MTRILRPVLLGVLGVAVLAAVAAGVVALPGGVEFADLTGAFRIGGR